MMQSPHDGVEGLGLLAETLLFISIPVLIAPVVTMALKVIGRLRTPHGRFVWWSLGAYCASLLAAVEFLPSSLGNENLKTGVFATLGTIAALCALFLAVRASGSGRVSAVLGSSFLVLCWLPFFWGRVLLRVF
jgi:hypothetical protein